jgi:hypothetical protein
MTLRSIGELQRNSRVNELETQRWSIAMRHDSPKSFRTVDYVVSPEKREIRHEATGISFRFNHSRGLAMLSRPERNFEEEIQAEFGARAVLDRLSAW